MNKYNFQQYNNSNHPKNNEDRDNSYDYDYDYDEDDYCEKAPKVRKFREHRAR